MTTATAPVAAKLYRNNHQYLFPTETLPYSQETRLHAPLSNSAINHIGRGKAEHNRNSIGQGQSPARCLGAQTLLRNLSRVRIANGRCAGG